RDRAGGLFLRAVGKGARFLRAARRLALSLPGFVGVLRGPARGLLARARRREIDAGTPRLRQADGDRLPGVACAMLAAADLLDLLAHELAGLRARRFSFPLVLAGPFDGSFVRHDDCPVTHPAHSRSVATRVDAARGSAGLNAFKIRARARAGQANTRRRR